MVDYAVGLRIGLFEACSALNHVAACTLARSPIRDPLPEGFNHFLTSRIGVRGRSVDQCEEDVPTPLSGAAWLARRRTTVPPSIS